MNSLLKSVHSMAKKKNTLVKDSLQKQLNTSVMEMQSAPGAMDDSPVGNCDEAMTLCSVLEAVFLHGLKDSLLNRVTEALSGPDFDAMPQPSFWGPLLVFSHRQIIDQIQSLPQITTEVGYCRAWIRLALNEGLLSSYLCSIRRENSALKPYYDKAAFIRDPDLVDVVQRLIESLHYINFELACNSSLLNIWSSTPLLMAAIWAPPMKSCPVFSAVDIAKTINSEASTEDFDENETASPIGSVSSFNSSQSMLSVANFTENGALKIILQQDSQQGFTRGSKGSGSAGRRDRGEKRRNEMAKRGEESDSGFETADKFQGEASSGETQRNGREKRDRSSEIMSAEEKTNPSGDESGVDTRVNGDTVRWSGIAEDKGGTEAGPGTIGNSLVGRPGWSTSFEDAESSLTASMISQGSGIDEPRTPGEGTTYDALIKSYHTAGKSISLDLDDFLVKSDDDDVDDEEISDRRETKPKEVVKILDSLEDQIGHLAREKGLDSQNYTCYDCSIPIGMTFSKSNVCSFNGNYYCNCCMATEKFLIPAKLIHNWDLKHYPVCRRAALYLTSCSTLLSLDVLNPRIYAAVDRMAQLRSLRIQLNLLRGYIFTCRKPIIECLQKSLAPREYLYEHVHQYSVSDLLDVPSGVLAQQLQKAVEFGRKHVLNCWLCSQKGFICEVCNNPKIIYPFDMQTTYRCTVCYAVFHADCLSSSKPCPKCERRRKRTDRPPLDIESVPTTDH